MKDDEENYDKTLEYIINNTTTFIATLLPLLVINVEEKFQNSIFELIINLAIKDEKNIVFL